MQTALRYTFLFTSIFLCGAQSCTPTAKQPDNRKNRFLDSSLSTRRFSAADSLLFVRAVDSAFRTIPHVTNQDKQDRYEALIELSYHVAANYDKALVYSDSLLMLMEQNGTSGSDYIDAVFGRGDILLALNRYDEAFTWYYRARQIVLQENDTCRFSSYTGRLAAVSFRQKRFKEAANFYKQSIIELKHCTQQPFKTFASIQGNYDNTGIMYSRMGWLDSAELYFDKALHYIDSRENEFPYKKDYMLMAKAVIYGNQADVAIKRGRTTQAKNLLKKGIAINIDPSRAPEDAAYSMLKLAGVYVDEGHTDSVPSLLKKIDSLYRVFPNDELGIRYLRLRARYENKIGNNSEAFHFLEKYTLLYDSIMLKKETDPSINLGSSLEQISRQYQLEHSNKRKNDYLIIAALFIAMFLVIKVLLWINYRRSQKSIKALNLLNQDISGKNNDLLQTLEKLEQMRRDKKKLMHVVAHDLRSPVGSITTLATMVRNEQIDKESIPEVLDMIIKAGTSAQTLINELLEERAKENEGRQEIIDLSALLQYSVGLLQYRAAEKEQQLHLQPVPAKVLSDREKLLRIIHNLLDNAIKFSPHGSVIRIEMELVDSKVQVRIIDQGIGIPENMRSALLNEVSAFTRKGTLGEMSFGLGLSIVSQLIREVEGKVWYTSKEGEGTSFFLEFSMADGTTVV